MSISQIHQFHPSVVPADAIGNNMLTLQSLFSGWGYRSLIFAEAAGGSLGSSVLPVAELVRHARPDGILVIHYSIASPWFELLKGYPGRKVLIYHNITPSEFFLGFNDSYYQGTKKGREELPSLAPFTDMTIGDSSFNSQELRQVGFANVHTLPLLVNLSYLDGPADPKFFAQLSDGTTNILYVGKIYPHKRVDEVIRTFAAYQRLHDPSARLLLSGTADGMETYVRGLQHLIRHLGVNNVSFLGVTSKEQLISLYRTAHVLVNLSAHEGFAMPLVEAMHFRLPVLAADSGAMSETLAGSGLCFTAPDPVLGAELMHRLVTDQDLRKELSVSAARQLDRLNPSRLQVDLQGLLAKLPEPPPPKVERPIAILASDRDCGIHSYALKLSSGFAAAGIACTTLGVPHRDNRQLRSAMRSIPKDIATLIVEYEPGLYHSGTLARELVRWRAFRRQRNLIVSIHELSLDKFPTYASAGELFHRPARSSLAIEMLRTLVASARLPWLYLKTRLPLAVIGAVSDEVLVHADMASLAVGMLSLKPTKLRFVPHMMTVCDPDQAQCRARLGLPRDKVLFFAGGFIVRRKRFMEIIDALPGDAHLVIAGTQSKWEPDYFGEVRQAAARHADRVHLITDANAYPDALGACDAAVLYYTWIAQSGVANEAVGAGKPCIFSDLTAFVELRRAGLVAANGRDLAAAMSKMLDSEIRTELHRGALELRERLSPERIAIQYLPLEPESG